MFKNRAVRKILWLMRGFVVVLPLKISGTKISSTLKFVMAHGTWHVAGKSEGRRPPETRGLSGRVILKWVLQNKVMTA